MINLNDEKYQPKKLITKEELLHKYSEYDIFRNYIGNFELGETYRSPLRRDDAVPSFNIFYSKRHNCLLFKDFAGKRGDCIVFVQQLLGLKSYQETIDQIDKDMNIIIPKKKLESSPIILEKVTTNIQIVVKPWEEKELSWWNSFGILPTTLKKYNVYSIKGYYSNNFYISTLGFAFAYMEYKDKTQTFKIYRPLASKANKWRSNHPFGVHQGYTQLPVSGELLIITKSLKDVMSLWDCASIPSIGIQSETCYIKQSVIDEYKFRFDNCITLFDNDEQGISQARNYEKLYDIPSIFIPKDYEKDVKDFSDLVKKVGRHEAIQILNKLLL